MPLFGGIVLSLLPGFTWLYFYLQEDCHPEPKKALASTFVIGGAFAFLTLGVQLLLQQTGWIVSSAQIESSEALSFLALGSIILLAFTEEFFKFFAAYTSIHKNQAFDEPVDAMIYSIVAALGFATIENIGAVHSNYGAYSNINDAIVETVVFRFVGATLLHTLVSGLIGYYWALGLKANKPWRYIINGFLVATLLHALFNYLIISYGNLMYALAFVAVVGFVTLSDFEKLRVMSGCYPFGPNSRQV